MIWLLGILKTPETASRVGILGLTRISRIHNLTPLRGPLSRDYCLKSRGFRTLEVQSRCGKKPIGFNGDHFDMRNFMPATLTSGRCLTFALLLSVCTFAQRAEITYLNTKGAQKTEDKATINEWTYKGLKFRAGSTKRDVPPESIVSVKFRNEPEILTEAMATLADGSLRAALPIFGTIIAGKDIEGDDLRKTQLWIQEHALYNSWSISRAIDRLDDAKVHRDALKKAYPKSHYLPEIEYREANDVLAFGDFAKADAAFTAFAARAEKLGFGNMYVVLGGLGKVRSLIEAGKLSDAETAHSKVAAKALGDSARKRCDVVRGNLLVAKKKIGAAESLFKQLLSKANYETEPFIFAGAANGVGDCHYASGKFKEAMYEYSKTFALLSGKDGLDHENGWAIWRFANSCKQIAAKAEGEAAKVYTSRFRKSRDQVAEEYRLSRGGQLARREKGMGK